ncbi:MAG: FecCD family ABC transporter permease [Vulcanimicrobiota bacterium]
MKKKLILIFSILLFVLGVSVWGCVHLGASGNIPHDEINKVIFDKLSQKEIIETPITTIVWDLRLPRVLLAAMVGAALALSGAAFQGLLRNPLADPYIVGTSAGAAVGGVIAIVFNFRGHFLGLSAISLFAFAGSVVAMYGIYRLSIIHGRVPVETFLLAGVVVGSFLWAMVSFLLTIAGKSLQEIVFWLMGSTQNTGWAGLLMLVIYLAIGIFGLMYFAHPLNVLTLGDKTAKHLGVDVEYTKIAIIIFASLVTAAAVSLSGLIGFVGLMIPHIARIILGADHRILFPASILIGAIFMVWVDTFARSAFAPREIPVGILTAILGAPFFLYLLRKYKKTL